MMTIPSELMDFTHIANATCTECVQRVKPGAPPARRRCSVTPEPRGQAKRIMGLGLDVMHMHLVAHKAR